jgi:parallel beta-helix repeat protein
MSKETVKRKKFPYTRLAVLVTICLAALGSCPVWAWDIINIPNQDNEIGTWDDTNRVFTLTTNVAASLFIVESDLTLDGAGYTVDGTAAPTFPPTNGIATQDSLSGVTIQNVTVLGFTEGIYIHNNFYCTVFNNTIDSSYHGIYVSGWYYNTIASNMVTNCNVGLLISNSNENTAFNNTFANNNYGFYMNSGIDNLIYNNNFLNNNTQARGNTGNTFSLPAPVGGNHWSNWTSPDDTNDGFVDLPYALMIAGIDELPVVELNGWLPDIEVAPTYYDFGNVEVITTRNMVITISNVAKGELEITDLVFTAESNPDFTIAEPLTLPITIGPGETIDIQIIYTPTAEGYGEAALQIASNDIDEELVTVTLVGVGEITELPPAEQIALIQTFYEDTIASGDLVGNGPNDKAAQNRLNALGNMLRAASDLIISEEYNGAIHLLTQISRRCDGNPTPPDFVAGDAAQPLHTMIIDLIADL